MTGKWIYLVIGSVAGGALRYILAGVVSEKLGTGFPYGTLLVNVAGCFLVGLFATMIDDKFFLGPNSRLLLMTGFCGAFTTFSTYMLETGDLVKNGQMTLALLNVLASTVAGFGAYMLGVKTGSIV